jgi:hypothetical protein
MSRIRRISYAITPEGHRANAIKQAVGLRDSKNNLSRIVSCKKKTVD